MDAMYSDFSTWSVQKIHKRNARGEFFPFIHSSFTFCVYVALKFEIVVKIMPSRKNGNLLCFQQKFRLKKDFMNGKALHTRCQLEEIVEKKILWICPKLLELGAWFKFSRDKLPSQRPYLILCFFVFLFLQILLNNRIATNVGCENIMLVTAIRPLR